MSMRNYDSLPSVLNRGRPTREVPPGTEGHMQEGRRAHSRSSSCDSGSPRHQRLHSLDPVSDDDDYEPIPPSQTTTSTTARADSARVIPAPARGFGGYTASSGFSGRFAPSSTAGGFAASFTQGSSAFGGSFGRSSFLPNTSSERETSRVGFVGSSAQPRYQPERNPPNVSFDRTRSPSPVLQNPMAGASQTSQVTTVQCSSRSRSRSATPASTTEMMHNSPLTSSTEQISSAFVYQTKHPRPPPPHNTETNHHQPRASTSKQTHTQQTQIQTQPLSIHNFLQAPVQYPTSSRPRPAQNGTTSRAPSAKPHSPEYAASTRAQTPAVLPSRDKHHPQPQKPQNGEKVRKRGDWKVQGYVHSHTPANDPPPTATLSRQAAFTASTAQSEGPQTYQYTESAPRKPPARTQTQKDHYVQPPSRSPTASRASSQVPPADTPSVDFSLLGGDGDDSAPNTYEPQGDYGREESYPPAQPDPPEPPPQRAPTSIPSKAPPPKPSAPAAVVAVPSGAGVGELETIEIIIEDERTGEELFIEDDFVLEPGPRGTRRLDIRKLGDVLQSGPSRRDGPAKVYTLRNGRKQYVVEISEDNVDKMGSGKVQIPDDFTLTLHVEYPQAPVKPSNPSQLALPSQAFATPHQHASAFPQLASPATSESASPAMAHSSLSTRKRTRLEESGSSGEHSSSQFLQKRPRDT